MCSWDRFVLVWPTFENLLLQTFCGTELDRFDQPLNDIKNGGWHLEDLEEDEEYTVRIRTVVNSRTVCFISQKIEEDEDGVFEKLPDTFYTEQQESVNPNRGPTESVWFCNINTKSFLSRKPDNIWFSSDPSLLWVSRREMLLIISTLQVEW